MKFKLTFISLFFLVNIAVAQNTDVPRDTSYTLTSALAHAQKYNKEKDINITGVYSNPSEKIAVKNDMVYKQMGERQLLANIYYPKKAKGKKPGIMIVHGGGWRSGDKTLMTPMAEKLADAGYFVITPEYRMSLESQYPSSVEDLYDAIKWMHDNKKKYKIDMEKLVVMGCSAGGQLATLVGTTYNQPENIYGKKKLGTVAAIVDVDGVLAFHHPDSEEGKYSSWWMGGTYEEIPEVWTEASALTHVDQYTPPTLFLASIHPRFLAGRQDFIAKLDKYNTASKTHFMDRAPHSFWLFNPWYEPTMKYTIDFLKNNL